ncbi:MAG: InlB B-repeat-containing protein, partial [Candidatus Enteromonas sp.]|nr:InlB B-repeat-containing protein [Candidatus Enteromonas sp.]
MKKNTKLLVLSLTSLMGLGLMGCDMAKAIPTNEKAEPEVIQDEATESDAIGNLLRLNLDTPVTSETVNFAPAIGYQVFNETPEKMSLRIFAVVDGYKAISAAKITSKVTSYREDKAVAPQDETVIKAETEFQVTGVYSSIKSDLGVTWSELVSAVEFPNPYYMVYTLNNIPLDHYFDTITLTFSATADTEKTKTLVFNPMGIHGDYATNIRYEEIEDTGTYKAFKKSAGSSIKHAYLPQKHVQVTDFYAKPLGDIVALNPNDNNGVFENWSNLEEVHLPDSITSIGGWGMSSSSLKKANIPVGVTSTGSTIFSSGARLEELDYDAANLVNTNEYSNNVNVLKVSAGVQSLPEKFFASGYGPTKVIYEGTEAQWAALKTDTNANNGFFIEEVYCSDTTTSTVTYHYGDGKIGEVTGDVATTAINGHLLKNPGNPVPNEAGKEFKGWFLDPNFQTPADFTAEVSGNLDLYAKYDDFGPGISMDNPTILDPNSPASFSANLVPGKKAEYMKFTMPATAAHGDWFYLMVDKDSSSVAADISSTSYMSPGITVYNANKEELVLGSDDIKDASKAQRVNRDDYRVRFYAEPGETYYFKGVLHTSASSNVYGTIAFQLFTYANDTADEALDLAYGVHADVENVSKYHKVIYKYVANETKTVALYKTQTGGKYGGFTVVDAANPTVAL